MRNKSTLPARENIGYLLGNMGNDFTFGFAGVFLMVFYTKVLGISSSLVGTLFLVARLLDALTDITMGRIVDHSRTTEQGKFRPWIRRMALPVAFSSFLMYQSGIAAASYGIKVTYMIATYLLWSSVFYTAINIPYGSMASTISRDPSHRAQLSTARSVGSIIANFLIGVGAPILLYANDRHGNPVVRPKMFPLTAAIFSIAAVICYLLCYRMTRERVLTEVKKKSIPKPKYSLKTILHDRALIGIVLASIGILAAQLLTQAINQYLFIDYFHNRTGISIVTVLSILPGLLLSPFAVRITTRYGKREVGVIGCIGSALSSAILFFIHTRSMWVYLMISTLGYFGIGIFNLMMWAFITDIIDDREVRTGQREDGTIYAVYSFARKLGQALAGGLGGWTLALIGFDETAAVQTTRVANGIYTTVTLIPAILYLFVTLCLGCIYPLSRKRVEENNRALKLRHAEQE
ncbi:MAG: MFS transporter [Clostridia bacterium]|nr:MFS transporter [Clostridia bacterium]